MSTARVLRAGLLLGALGATGTGCLVGPDYNPPDVDVPTTWHQEVAAPVEVDEFSLAEWWFNFDDEKLPGLIERALAANNDLKVAATRIEAARAGLGLATSQFFPDVNAGGTVQRYRRSESSPGLPPGFEPRVEELYDLNLNASWELDVFGRVRRSVEAAQADYEGIVDDFYGVRVALVAEVALAYGQVRQYQGLLRRVRDGERDQAKTLEVARSRDAARGAPLDVAQAERNLAMTRAEIPLYERGIEVSANRLAVLLGRPPGELTAEMYPPRPLPSAVGDISIDQPASLLNRRPDVRAAERRLAAETARVGVATADLYPRFSMLGFFGNTTTQGGTLFNAEESSGYSFGPAFRWNLFDGWRIQNRIRFQETRAQAALVQYEQSVLLALEEVEDNLAGYRTELARHDTLELALEAAQRTVDLVHEAYAADTADFQNVVDAERTLLEVNQEAAASRGRSLGFLVRLYKAVGGGWGGVGPEGVPAAPEAQAAPETPAAPGP